MKILIWLKYDHPEFNVGVYETSFQTIITFNEIKAQMC